MTLPVSPCGHLERRVADLARLLTEDRAQQALLRRELGLALRRDLADEHVAGADLGADADDAALVEVLQDVLGEVRDVAGDLLGAELRVAGVDLVLLDVDRGEHVVAHETLREDDRVLEVVTLPRHERHEQVLAERELALVGRRAVGEDVALRPPRRRLSTSGFWLMQVPWFDRRNFDEPVRDRLRGPSLYVDRDRACPSTSVTVPSPSAMHELAGVARGTGLDAGADERRLGPQQRDGLALHVGAHERAVGVVVLEERDQRGRDRDDLLRRDVHVVDLGRVDERDLATARRARARARRVNLPFSSIDGVRLGDDVAVLVVGREVLDRVGGDAR